MSVILSRPCIKPKLPKKLRYRKEKARLLRIMRLQVISTWKIEIPHNFVGGTTIGAV